MILETPIHMTESKTSMTPISSPVNGEWIYMCHYDMCFKFLSFCHMHSAYYGVLYLSTVVWEHRLVDLITNQARQCSHFHRYFATKPGSLQ